jgi:hypothetical protein
MDKFSPKPGGDAGAMAGHRARDSNANLDGDPVLSWPIKGVLIPEIVC